jgi:Glycosyl transferase family 90
LRSTRYVSSYERAADVCSQPDLRFASGFLMSPASFKGTHLPVPIFSQSRIEPYNDILAPSPWYYSGRARYEEEKDHVWSERRSTLFWRGATTNGVSHDGGWRFHLRERFIRVAERLRGDVDVGFTEITRCRGADCDEEARAFNLKPNVQFEEFFKYKYLPDIDGAAFSGRWIAFLKSRGLPFKLAIFREWFDSRFVAWRHFVPLDVRLRDRDFRTVVDWFMAEKNSYWGKRIADAGREWALQTLRDQDAEVYFFRLLLEYARVMNDERDRMGFTLS